MLMNSFNLPALLSRLVILMIAFTIHELSHALLADHYGDPLPRQEGRITLNPLKHLDPFGSLMLLLVGFGWAKPVNISPGIIQRNSKSGLMWISLAGPASNLALAGIGALIYKWVIQTGAVPLQGDVLEYLSYFFLNFVIINISLFVFNLIPLAPLDGEKVVEHFIPYSARPAWDRIQAHGMQILMVLFMLLPYMRINIFTNGLFQIVRTIFNLMMGRSL